MSYNSLAAQVQDIALIRRIDACAHQEAIENSAAAESDYGAAVRANQVSPAATLGWAVCVATESEYEYALISENPNPGGDDTVITDAMILSAVQTNWPESWPIFTYAPPIVPAPEV